MAGPALGRPRKVQKEDKREMWRVKEQLRRDERYRIPIEGKFGQGKRRFSLNKIMSKLASTSEATIGIIFLVMNLEKLLQAFLFSLLRFFIKLIFKAKKRVLLLAS